MGLKLFIFLWISALSTPIFASIHLCNAGIQSKVCKQVKKEEDYVREISPFPQPTAVKVTLNILDILDVNENEQTMTLFIKLRLYWIDKQLSLNKTENDIQMKKFWFIISLDDIGDIWTPDVYVGNAVTNLGSFGDTRGRLTHFWFQTDDQAVLLVEKRIVSFSCKMKFEEFPFDSHKCEMMLYVFVGGSHQVKLNKPTLFVFDSSIGDEISGSKVNKSSENLDMYSFSFEAMESSELKENGFKYSKVAIKVYFERTEKGRAKIFSSYHATTGTFSLLSMISFLIDPSQVPGRLGLLITLCLIMINSYNSVDAPAKRGFSTIEMWFVGTLTPVLFALLEYGLVLALLKYGDLVSGLCEGLRISSKTLMKSIDFVSLILATAYFVCFNVYFWRL